MFSTAIHQNILSPKFYAVHISIYALAYSIIHKSMAAFKTIDMYMYIGIAIMYVLRYKRLSRYKAILISSIKISPQ